MMAMQRLGRTRIRLVASAVLAVSVAACSTDLSLNNVTLAPKSEALARKPDWATFSGGRNDFELRPIVAADLVGPEGQCAAAAGQSTGFADSTSGEPGAAPLTPGGISLQMTECDVVRRAGVVDTVNFGVNERGERAVVLTFLKGPWPGVYRFTGGRLVAIERAPSPPPAPAKQQKGAKKPAAM
jgi:hypothetical protein